jgi:DNA-binding Lrp family transcriptional regulator
MNEFPEFDENDRRIVEKLRRNGRATHQEIAKELGLVPTTVSARIRRMEEAGMLSVVAVTDFAVHGFHVLIHLGIEVSGRDPLEIAEDLAKFDEIFSVYVVTGRFEVSAVLALPNVDELPQFILHKFSKVPGIRSVTQSIGLDIVKFGLVSQRLHRGSL